MTTINELIQKLEARLADEQTRIEREIARVTESHQSLGEGYWKELYEIQEALRAARKVKEAIDDIDSV